MPDLNPELDKSKYVTDPKTNTTYISADVAKQNGFTPSAVAPTVAATSEGTRTGISNTGTAINDGLNTNVGNTLLSSFDSSNLTGDYQTVQKNLQERQTQLATERDQELVGINNLFNAERKTLENTQANETGGYSAKLARMGGYLGDSVSGEGAMVNLNNLHIQQMQAFESKRQAALQGAQKAYNDQNYKLADQLVQESKNYHSEMLQAQNQFADLQLKQSADQRAQAELKLKQEQQQAQLQQDQQAAQEFAIKYSIPPDKSFYTLGGVLYRTQDRKPVTMDEYLKTSPKGDHSDIYALTGNAAAEKEMVAQMQKDYGDAGITPTDTIATATAKLKSSALYNLKFPNGMPGTPGSPSSGSLLDPSSVSSYLADKSPDQQAAFQNLSELDKSDVMQLTNGDVLLSDLMASRGVAGSAARQQLLLKARAVDPTFSENVNKQRYAFKTKWNDENGKAYNTRTSINTGLGHLATLKSLTNQLSGNSNFQKANSIQQFINDNINGPNAEIVAKFKDTVSLLAEEIAKAYKGGVPDKDEVQRQLDSLNPIKPSNITSAVIDNKVNLMTSLLQAQGNEFHNVMGKYPEQLLHREVLDEMQNAGINTQGVTKTLIQQGMHASSIHDYVNAFPEHAATAEKILRENPSLSDDDVLQILQPSFNNAGSGANNAQQPTALLPTSVSTTAVLGGAKPAPLTLAVAQKYPAGSTGPGEGAYQGQCAVYVEKLVDLPTPNGTMGDSKAEKFTNIDNYGIPAKQWTPQVGDVIVTNENAKYGHTAVVTAILPGNKIQLSESNFKASKQVSHDRVLDSKSPVIHGAFRGTLKVQPQLT